MILWILHYVGLILELFQKHTRRSPEPSLFSNVLKTGRRFCTLLVLNATPIQYSYYLWFALDCLIYSLHDFHKQGLLFRVWHCLYTKRYLCTCTVWHVSVPTLRSIGLGKHLTCSHVWHTSIMYCITTLSPTITLFNKDETGNWWCFPRLLETHTYFLAKVRRILNYVYSMGKAQIIS